MNNDLFELSILESDDEFASDSPADPTKHFDSDNSGEKAISVPNDVKLDVDTYNQALDALKKSFKEGVEVLDMLQKFTIDSDFISESTFTEQEEYTDEAITEAVFNSYLEGPIFEAVNRSDKKPIKAITNKCRNHVESVLVDKGFYYCKARRIFPLIMSSVHFGTVIKDVNLLRNGKGKFTLDGVEKVDTGEIIGQLKEAIPEIKDSIIGAFGQDGYVKIKEGWDSLGIDKSMVPQTVAVPKIGYEVTPLTTGAKVFKIVDAIRAAYFGGTRLVGAVKEFVVSRAWQTVCLAFIPKKQLDATIQEMNDKCKEELGEYKFIAIPINRNIATLIDRVRALKSKNLNFFAYLIVVDKNMPAGVDKEQEKIDSALKEVVKEGDEKVSKGKAAKKSVKTESVTDESVDNEEDSYQKLDWEV